MEKTKKGINIQRKIKKVRLFLVNSKNIKSPTNKKNNQNENELSLINNVTNGKSIKIRISSEKKNNNILDTSNLNNTLKEEKPFILTKNLFSQFNNTILPYSEKHINRHFSIEKALHYSIIEEENEITDNPSKFISKLEKGKKLHKLYNLILSKEKSNQKKQINFYNKFVNKNITNQKNKNIWKYSEIYLKKINFNKNI